MASWCGSEVICPRLAFEEAKERLPGVAARKLNAYNATQVKKDSLLHGSVRAMVSGMTS